MRSWFSTMLVANGLALIVPTAAQAGTLALDFTGGSTYNTSGGAFGWKFTVGNAALDVVALDGFDVGDQVRLYNASGTTLASATLASGTSVGSGAKFYSVAPNTVVTLAANTTYYIVEGYASGTSFIENASSTSTNGITYLTGVSGSGNPLGDALGSPTNGYFGPSFEFNVHAASADVPEIDANSAASALALLSMGAAFLKGRRKSA